MKTVVILNAPPHSGKDTIADLMVRHLKANKLEFKEALYEAMADYYNIKLPVVKNICTNRYFKDTKRSDFSFYTGLTPRQGLIYVSESIYKPKYGVNYFGCKAAEGLLEGVNTFADGGGWWDELAPVVNNSDQVVICRLYRNGYSFDGDSRDYYNPSTMPKLLADTGKITICDLHLEEGKPYAALDAIAEILK